MSVESIFDLGTWRAAVQNSAQTVQYDNNLLTGLTYSSNFPDCAAPTAPGTLALTIDGSGVVKLDTQCYGEATFNGIALSLFPEFDLGVAGSKHLQLTQVGLPGDAYPYGAPYASSAAAGVTTLSAGTHDNWLPDPVDLGAPLGGKSGSFYNDYFSLHTGALAFYGGTISMRPQLADVAVTAPTADCTAPQLEIWPAPAAAYNLRIRGYPDAKTFGVPKSDGTYDDTAETLCDGRLVFLMALANAKAHYGKADAQVAANELNSLLGRLRAGRHGNYRYIPGGDPIERPERLWVPPKWVK